MFRILYISDSPFASLNLKICFYVCLLKPPRRIHALSFRLWGHLVCGFREKQKSKIIKRSDGHLISWVQEITQDGNPFGYFSFICFLKGINY